MEQGTEALFTGSFVVNSALLYSCPLACLCLNVVYVVLAIIRKGCLIATARLEGVTAFIYVIALSWLDLYLIVIGLFAEADFIVLIIVAIGLAQVYFVVRFIGACWNLRDGKARKRAIRCAFILCAGSCLMSLIPGLGSVLFYSSLGIMAIPFAIYASVFLLCAIFLSLMDSRNEREEGGSM